MWYVTQHISTQNKAKQKNSLWMDNKMRNDDCTCFGVVEFSRLPLKTAVGTYLVDSIRHFSFLFFSLVLLKSHFIYYLFLYYWNWVAVPVQSPTNLKSIRNPRMAPRYVWKRQPSRLHTPLAQDGNSWKESEWKE